MHLHSISAICEIAELDRLAKKILEEYSPGPLTLILQKKDGLVFSSNLKTIGVRIPRNFTALNFISKVNLPIAAPSANLSGRPSMTRFVDVVNEFDGKVDLILRGEEPDIGIESTVVDFTSSPPIILRYGEISKESLVKFIPNLSTKNEDQKVIRSPGLKYSHYAPDCDVVLLHDLSTIQEKQNSAQIGFKFAFDLNLNILLKDNIDYMKNLYSFFIDCDKMKIKTAYCEIPKDDERKPALLDRLLRASKK